MKITKNKFIKIIKNTKYKKIIAKKLNENIFVADIETTIINKKHIPVIIGYKKLYTNFEKITNINFNIKTIQEDSNKLIYNFLKDFIKLSKKKKKNYYIFS